MSGAQQVGSLVSGLRTMVPSSALFGRMSTQKVVFISVTAGMTLLGILARYLRRRRRTVKPDFFRKYPRRYTKSSTYSIKSPNGDVLSQASGSTAAGGHGPRLSRRGSVLSMHTMSTDRLSLPSSSVVGGAPGDARAPLAPQELGSLGMEALETAISYWYEVLEAYQRQSRAGGTLAIPSAEEAEFTAHLQELLDDAYRLQEQGDQLFHDERSILFKAESSARGAGSVAASLSEYRSNTNSGVVSSPESFVSAQDEVADLRELDEFQDTFPGLDTLPLYKDAVKKLEEEGIPYRCLRTEMVHCNSDTEYLSKLHCVRLAFQYLFLDHSTWQWFADAGRQVLVDLLLFADKDPKDFLVAYEEMLEFLQELKHWEDVEKELGFKGVKAMTFFDVVMDYILMDAFDDLDNPPSSVTAVIQNRWLSNGFKETALATAVWSVLKAKRRMLKYPYGFMSHFYSISEHMSPLMAWGFLGPDEKLREVCYYFRDQVMGLLQDIFSFNKSRYTVVGELASDIFTHIKTRVDYITEKLSVPPG